jgi:hypothetical protein
MEEAVRVQTGVRLERRLLKVLKGLSEYLGMSLGDLLEGIVLHAFEQKVPFESETIEVIDRLREIYHLDLRASDSHKFLIMNIEDDTRTPVADVPPERRSRQS